MNKWNAGLLLADCFGPCGITRRTLLGLVAATPSAGAAEPSEPVTRYLQSLSRPDEGYGWADEPSPEIHVLVNWQPVCGGNGFEPSHN